MESLQIIQWITGIILVALLLGFGYHLGTLAPESSEQSPDTTTSPASVSSAAALADGVQTVTLSWGKFNYKPDTITIQADTPVQITADLTRLQGCFQTLIIPDLGITHYFDKNNDVLTFTPTKKGTFLFTCAMGMGKGTLIVQ
ncbi:cupredoxin domain-containing protein [Candidatus Woesearchaeota archaeon]|nr:cupredoxin domain-containing protein [Candidatus Woesearchaeota archaeon]